MPDTLDRAAQAIYEHWAHPLLTTGELPLWDDLGPNRHVWRCEALAALKVMADDLRAQATSAWRANTSDGPEAELLRDCAEIVDRILDTYVGSGDG